MISSFFVFDLHVQPRTHHLLRNVGDREFREKEACGDEAVFELLAIYHEFDNGLDAALAGVKRVWVELPALFHAEKPVQNVILRKRLSVRGTCLEILLHLRQLWDLVVTIPNVLGNPNFDDTLLCII